MSKNISLSFQLHHCKNWQLPSDLLACIRQVIEVGHLVPLENKLIPIDENKNARPVAVNISEWFEKNYTKKNEWDEKEFEWFKYKEKFIAFLRTTLHPGWEVQEPVFDTIEIYLDASSFGPSYNYITFSSTLFQQWQTWLGELSDLFMQLAFPVIELLQPEYAAITGAEQFVPYGQKILLQELPSIFWGNYFGPGYLRKYGEEIFFTAPGWRVEELASGIWYQLSENVSDPPEKLVHEISAHFAPINQKITVR